MKPTACPDPRAAALAALPVALLAFDGQQRLLLANAALHALLGSEPGELPAGLARGEVLRRLARRGLFGPGDPEALAAAAPEPGASHGGLLRTQAGICLEWLQAPLPDGGHVVALPGTGALADRLRRAERAAAERDGATIRLRDHQPPDGGWLAEVTDITHRPCAGQAARQRIALHDALFDSLPVGVAVYGADRRVRYVNPAYNRIFAHSPVRVGEHLRDILLRRARAGEFGDCDPALEADLRVGRVGQPASFERLGPGGTVTVHQSIPLEDGGHAMVVADITALSAAQAEARVRAELLATTLESTRHGIAMVGADGRVIVANRLAAHYCGLPPERFVPGVAWRELRALQLARGALGDRETAAAFLAERDRTGLAGPHRYRRPGPGGITVEVITDPLPGGGFVRSYSDISALAEAEAEARARAATLQTVLDSMRHGVILYDGEGRVRTANALAARLAGLPAQALRPGVHFDELRDLQAALGEHGPPEAAPADRRASTAAPWHQEGSYTRTRPDGTVLEVRTDRIAGGGCVRSFTDITPLAAAQAELARRNAMLQVMLDTMRHGIVLYDAEERVLIANQLAAELLGAPGAVVPGASFGGILAAQTANGEFGTPAEAEALIRGTLPRDWTRPQSYRRRRPNGVTIEVATNPVPGGGFVLTVTDVTERVRAEAEAERRAAVLEAALNASRHSVTLYDRERRVVATNRIAAEVTGYPDRAAMLGASFDEVIERQARREHPADPAGQRAFLAAYQPLDRTVTQRYQRRHPDGRVLEVQSEPTPDGGFAISVADVTALVNAQEEAQRRAGVLQTMLDNISMGILLYDRERRLIAVNDLAAAALEVPGIAALRGRPLEEVLRRQAEAGNFGEGEAAERLFRQLCDQDRSVPGFHQRVTSSGRVLNNASHPTPDGGFVISIADVTPLARAQQEADRRAGILGAMLGNIRQGIALFDAEGTLVASNPKLSGMLELSPGFLRPGMTMRAMVETLHARGEYGEGPAGDAVAAAILARPRHEPVRSVRRRPDGTIVEAVSDPTPDGGFVVTYTDVTEDRRIRAALERARAEAEAANLAKSRFLATMSHELRSPLNAVIGFAEVLQGDASAEQAREFALAIGEAGRHLLSLIDDILDVTRAETGSLPVALAPLAPWPLLAGVERMMRETAERGGLALTLAPPAPLPRIRADERRLRQVLLNLVTNAVKFTQPGGRITLDLRHDAEGLAIEVADTGIGIAASDIERVFEPFTQIDSQLARRYPGAGLGLHLCRVLMDAQGGTLRLDSREGEGTRAILRFPPESVIADA